MSKLLDRFFDFLPTILFVFGSGFAVGVMIGGAAYNHIGTKSFPCFANHTCRENLKCLVADGIDATCVKP